MTEYVDDPDRTQTAMQNGLYHTGDQAFVDRSGYFYFVGRGDDVVKSSDYRISPFELSSVRATALHCQTPRVRMD